MTRSTLQQLKATLNAVSYSQKGIQQQSIIPTIKLGITSTPAERSRSSSSQFQEITLQHGSQMDSGQQTTTRLLH